MSLPQGRFHGPLSARAGWRNSPTGPTRTHLSEDGVFPVEVRVRLVGDEELTARMKRGGQGRRSGSRRARACCDDGRTGQESRPGPPQTVAPGPKQHPGPHSHPTPFPSLASGLPQAAPSPAARPSPRRQRITHLPLVLGPLLAIDTMPRLLCLSESFISSGNLPLAVG